MDRSRRKRKLTDRLRNSFVEFPALGQEQAAEIKLEPPEEVTAFCRLCKSSTGVKLLALFGRGRKCAPTGTVEKVRRCLGVEISTEHDPEALICRACLTRLDRYDAFRSRALQCNEYAQNQMADDEAQLGDDVPAEVRVCRFCLKIGGRLMDLYPEGGASEEQQLAMIRESLDVEINLWDSVTKICRICLQSLEELVAFRKELLPESVYVKQEEKPELSNLGALAEILDMHVSDSDCSLKDGEDPLEKTNLKIIQPELVALLGTDREGRNFTVLKDDGERLKIAFEGFQFQFSSMQSKGKSWWNCAMQRLRTCRKKLEIDALGMGASTNGRHNHSARLDKLMECPAGKGKMPFNKLEMDFWFYYGDSKQYQNTRTIFLDGFKYYLSRLLIGSAGSKWNCSELRQHRCKATLLIDGIFERAELKGKHTHKAMLQRKIEWALISSGIDLESSEAITTFRRDNPSVTGIAEDREVANQKNLLSLMRSATKEKQPEIFRVLGGEEDPERNFQVTRTGAKFKLCKDGYEHRYYGRLEGGVTVWKCIMDSLNHCQVVVKLGADAKRLEPFNRKRHSHGTEPMEVLSYPIGQRMVGGEPVWLLSRVSLYYESRFVCFRGFLFIMQEINRKGLIRWCCLRKHSCRTLLITKGNFDEMVQKGEHSHEKLSDDELGKLIEGKPSATPQPTENLSFRQKLLSYPCTKGSIWDEDRVQFETFYVLSDVNKAVHTGYGFVFRGHRYAFGSLDQNESSQWICLWQETSRGSCKAKALVEGQFQSVRISCSHNHDDMTESELQHMLKRSLLHPTLGESSLEILPEPEPSNILATLARPDPERNFEVKRTKYKFLVTYEGENFRLKSRSPDGSSVWSCVWTSARKCKVLLHLKADGKMVTVADDTKKHTHSDQEIAVFSHELGKLQIFDEDKDEHLPCWLFSYTSEYRENRGIIYQEYKYMLYNINNAGVSKWKCHVTQCKCFARISNTMKIISVRNGPHTHHEPLTQQELKSLTGTDNPQAPITPPTPPSEALPPRYSTLQRILATEDPNRNFQPLFHQDQTKIAHDGFEYNYSSSEATHSLWRCNFSTIRKCRAKLHLDHDGKRAFLPDLPKHNHRADLWELFYYPRGPSTIMNAYTETTEPFHFLVQPSFLRPIPFLIYGRHKYTIRFITESGDSCKWQCVGNGCRVCLTVTGLFELLVEDGGEHVDAPLSEGKIAEFARKYGSAVEEGTGGEEVVEQDNFPFVEVHMKEWYGDGVVEL
ncbi:conserved hypothetical protein [Culex quinquefasciatus]|uniref:ZAD domain-containing protein n=1 Tax=Culex quinquefasciatus TaxID=7176 RepID=B0WLK9_CULQU|nr:conserved hypothetical protein [Culex quinquefasciatus]|eukprot:XP_001849593.1 conserved hypothetical protein [Culex quinquefasciatus]